MAPGSIVEGRVDRAGRWPASFHWSGTASWSAGLRAGRAGRADSARNDLLEASHAQARYMRYEDKIGNQFMADQARAA